MSFSIERYHDFSCGHRVYGHESKCAHLHGHNYRVFFTCIPKTTLDGIGRVIDFSAIKDRLCEWLETNWDHKMLIWERDPLAEVLQTYDPKGLVEVPFNPTAEHMAQYLVTVVGPEVLRDTGVILASCKVEETRKCSATYLR